MKLTGRPAAPRASACGPTGRADWGCPGWPASSADRWRWAGRSRLVIAGLLVFVGGLAALAVLVPVGHGFAPKGGGWFIPAVVGGVFTLHPLLIALTKGDCFRFGVCGGGQ